MLGAVHNVENIIGPVLVQENFDVSKDLARIDEFMIRLDGTRTKNRLGGNAILGISMACARAGAAAKVCPSVCSQSINQSVGSTQNITILFFSILS